jgi:GNAT superfamily N-acetyltransferase
LNSDLPPHVIRPVTPGDLEMVRQIDRDAFDAYRREHNQPRQLHLRTVGNVRAAIRREYPGVVIEWPPGRVVGYCFTHVWGSLGWLGTLGITPRSQGFGLGRAVIAAGLDILRSAGCQILALETMPESGKNLALYLRLGLEARQLTLLCQGTPERTHKGTHFEIWNEGSQALFDITSRLVPGLDPTPIARWLIEEQAGETLVWREAGEPAAFAVLRLTPRRLEALQTYLSVEVAACLPEAASHWPRYLSEMQTYAQSLGKIGIVLPINTRQTELLQSALSAGLQIVHTRVRMIAGGDLGAPDALLMLTLAM